MTTICTGSSKLDNRKSHLMSLDVICEFWRVGSEFGIKEYGSHSSCLGAMVQAADGDGVMVSGDIFLAHLSII